MILFGHLGLTLAAARITEKTLIKETPKIDYRVVLIGSMLPDLIDKTVLFFLSNETLRSGRMFAHSFLFAFLLFILGLSVRQLYKKSWVMVLAACVFVHQLLDAMWKHLDTFLWPVYDIISTNNIESIKVWEPESIMVFKTAGPQLTMNGMQRAMSRPAIYIPEVIGGFILLYFVLRIIARKQVINFLLTGKWGK